MRSRDHRVRLRRRAGIIAPIALCTKIVHRWRIEGAASVCIHDTVEKDTERWAFGDPGEAMMRRFLVGVACAVTTFAFVVTPADAKSVKHEHTTEVASPTVTPATGGAGAPSM